MDDVPVVVYKNGERIVVGQAKLISDGKHHTVEMTIESDLLLPFDKGLDHLSIFQPPRSSQSEPKTEVYNQIGEKNDAAANR